MKLIKKCIRRFAVLPSFFVSKIKSDSAKIKENRRMHINIVIVGAKTSVVSLCDIYITDVNKSTINVNDTLVL